MKSKLMAFLTGMLLLTGCGETLDENNCTIAGSVSDRTTGEPVAVVNITLSPGGYSTVTGSDGTFSFNNIEAGTYTIQTSKENYSSATGTVSVRNGETASAHLLIERRAASLTSDKTELDFGKDLSTLSFNVVNPGYKNLHFTVETGGCDWVKCNPRSADIEYGKTSTIIVTIDRNQLKTGSNMTTIVVKSSDGSGNIEISVKAEGDEYVPGEVSTSPVTEINSFTARLEAEIVKTGTPYMTGCGFLVSTDPNFTEGEYTKRFEAVKKGFKFAVDIVNLEYNTTYYVKAYLLQGSRAVYGNIVQFTTLPILPEIGTGMPTDVECWGINYMNYKMTLHGEVFNVGKPEYTERGFCYAMDSYAYWPDPTIKSERVVVKGTGPGKFSVEITGVKGAHTFSRIGVRTYVIQNGKPVYGPLRYYNSMKTP